VTGRLGCGCRTTALAAKLGRITAAACSDRGATATEYALLVGFIAVVIAIAVGFFGTNLDGYYNHITSAVGAFL
jgi:pilus assembly protein Flp/PilA